ncbi:MAG: RNA polymerase sigma factor [Betaproteobacteria bacterium]|jgi:RNA polymerase sigma-70 factor (ECF subfamily)|nr:RNA polymerase sigma factor [Betaproteobacteria bacterium]
MDQLDEASDEDLMLRYAAGEAGAFDRLYARHRGGVFRYLLHHCGRRAAAEELFQEVWLNLVKTRASYLPSARFASFIYRCAHNRLIDYYRSQGKVFELSIDDEDGPSELIESLAADPGEDPAARALAREASEQVRAALRRLPPPQREAFLLQQEGGLSLADISVLTGVPAETVKSRLRYALSKLRGELAELAP